MALRLLSPPLVLAVFSAVALVREVRSVRREAVADATDLAEAAANRLEVSLSPDPVGRPGLGHRGGRGEPEFLRIGPGQELLDPLILPWPPRPEPIPDPMGSLRREAWTGARAAFRHGDWEMAVEGYDRYLEGEPASDARQRGNARLERALAMEQLGGEERAVAAWLEVLESGTSEEVLAPTEGGIPVGHLAMLRLLGPGPGPAAGLGAMLRDVRGRDAARWERFGRLLVDVGSPFSRVLLERWAALLREVQGAGAWAVGLEAAVREGMARADRIGGCYGVASRLHPVGSSWPAVFWIDGPGGGRLAVEVPGGGVLEQGGRQYGLLPETWVREELQEAVRASDRRGAYVVRVRLAGRELESIGGDPADAGEGPGLPSAADLASVRRMSGAGVGFQVEVALADPDAFFSGQRWRASVFGGLLGGALVVSVIAVWSTHRSLVRQHELGVQKSNFVSSVSHELRAPLASIRLLAEGLERGSAGDELGRAEYHRLIVRETRRLGTLVENVLDFSRIEQGRKSLERVETDLGALVEGSVRVLEPLARERGVVLELLGIPRGGEGGILEILADGNAIQQALLNLLDNGMKHSPPGATLSVSVSREGDGGTDLRHAGGVVRIAVRDSGPGIPLDEQARIFEPFHRLGSELRRETEGVGIGLSIVKHIAEAHGGGVTVRSEPGHGAVFILTLPCAC